MLGTLVIMVTPPFIRLAAADVGFCSPFPLTSSLLVSTEPLPPSLASLHRSSSGHYPRRLCTDTFLPSGRNISLCTFTLWPPGIPKRTEGTP